ncbi:MAG: helicase-associated domain-containing protein [Dehalococcoidia bacterium]
MTAEQATSSRAITKRLRLFSVSALQKLARQLDVFEGKAGKEQFEQLLVGVIGETHHHETLKRKFAEEDWAALRSVLPRRQHVHPVSLALSLWYSGEPPAVAMERTVKLLGYGCFLPLEIQPTTTRLEITRKGIESSYNQGCYELTPGVAAWVEQDAPPAKPLGSWQPPETIVESTAPELQRTILVLLTELERRPVRITKQGTPNKTDMVRLAAAVVRGGGRPAKQVTTQSVPVVLWFALAVLAGARLLDREGGVFRPAAGAASFLGLPIEERVRRLYEGWLASPFDELLRIPTLTFSYGFDPTMPWAPAQHEYGPNEEEIRQAHAGIDAALRGGLATMPDGWFRIEDLARSVFLADPEFLFDRIPRSWYSSSSFSALTSQNSSSQRASYPGVGRLPKSSDRLVAPFQRQDPLFLASDWPEVEGAFVRQVLAESWRWLGLVDVGPDAGTPSRFHLTDLGQQLFFGKHVQPVAPVPAGRVAVVQPNFEVVVFDSSASLGLLAQLDAFAERRSLDRAATFVLTEADLWRGLDHGWKGDQVRQTLESATGGPLPQNVHYSLDEWIASYERLALYESATFLEADDPGQFDSWLVAEDLGGLLGARLGPTSVLVPARNLQRVSDWLTKQGQRPTSVDYATAPGTDLEIDDPDLVELAADPVDPYLRYRLHTFADEIQGTPKTLRFQISEKSISRALEGGYGGKRLLDFLKARTDEIVPADFTVRLLGWGGAMVPILAESVVALRLVSSEVTWELLRQIPEIGQYVKSMPNPSTALVAPEQVGALSDELGARGVKVRPIT